MHLNGNGGMPCLVDSLVLFAVTRYRLILELSNDCPVFAAVLVQGREQLIREVQQHTIKGDSWTPLMKHPGT